MLTGKTVRVQVTRDRVKPRYLDTDRADWLDVAEQMLELFRGQEGRTRGEIEEDVEEAFGDDPSQLVHQGLRKLLEDRCEFEVVSGHPPEELREAVFRAAALERGAQSAEGGAQSAESEMLDSSRSALRALRSTSSARLGFDRDAVLKTVAASLDMTLEQVEAGLFADLKSEQRLIKFRDLSAKHLLERYNVGLAQAVLLRSVRVQVTVRGEPAQRYRALLRTVKFHRLICDIQKIGPDSHRLTLDGPLSLFSATQKYGLQLALFLPAVLPCRDFEVRAEVNWGVQKRSKLFLLTPDDGLVAAYDPGSYVPPEMRMFADLFAKRQPDWEITEETDVFPLGDGFWVPDFRLRHRLTKKLVRLEVLGFWRRATAEAHLERLRRHVKEPFLLAVSASLQIDDADLEGLPAGIIRFRQMPLPDEVARRAADLLGV